MHTHADHSNEGHLSGEACYKTLSKERHDSAQPDNPTTRCTRQHEIHGHWSASSSISLYYAYHNDMVERFRVKRSEDCLRRGVRLQYWYIILA